MQTSNDIAEKLAVTFPKGGWLTVGQTAWIMNQYRRDSARLKREHDYAEGSLKSGGTWMVFVKAGGASKFVIQEPKQKEAITDIQLEDFEEHLEEMKQKLAKETDAVRREKLIGRIARCEERLPLLRAEAAGAKELS